MILFWNPWDHWSTQEEFPGILVIINMIRKVKNVKNWAFRDFGYCDGNFSIVASHMILSYIYVLQNVNNI